MGGCTEEYGPLYVSGLLNIVMVLGTKIMAIFAVRKFFGRI